MKKQWKRMLAGALPCALALSLLPAAASAAEPEPVYQGDGYYITVELYGNQELDLDLSAPFSDGLIRFGDFSSYGFADKDGNVVIPSASWDDRGYNIAGYFSDGLCLVRGRTDDGTVCGYIDKSGQLAIPMIYEDAQPFVNGAAAVATVGSDRVEDWNFIDTSGNFILTEVGGSTYAGNDPSPLSEDRFFQFRDSWRVNSDDGQYGIFNGDGQLLTTITRQDLGGEDMNYMYPSGGYSEGYLVLATESDYTEDGLDCAVIDRDGNLVWAGYDYRVYYGNDRLCYDAGVHSGLLVVLHNASSLSRGSAVVNVETGEFLPLPGENLTLYDDFRDGLATASGSGSGFGVVDTRGNDVIPLGELGQYSRISPFNEGLAIAEIDDQYYLLEKHEGTYSGQQTPAQPEQPEQPETVAGFTDVPADAWYASFVETVTEKGLFSGKGNGIFAPNDSMTYAEFLVVLSQFSGETVTPVEGGAWYEGYVNWAQPLIPSGMAEGFNPNAAITRQDMAALFGTFLSAYDYSAELVNQDEPAFTDADAIADYAAGGVELCYQLGIMSGNTDGSFAPLNTATRAEVAVTMTQMARVMGR